MITNKVLKEKLDNALTNLNEANADIYDAWLLASNKGIRADIANSQVHIEFAKEFIEDLLYDKDNEPEVYELIEDNGKVTRFSEINHI